LRMCTLCQSGKLFGVFGIQGDVDARLSHVVPDNSTI
jgi:hypothetical protein